MKVKKILTYENLLCSWTAEQINNEIINFRYHQSERLLMCLLQILSVLSNQRPDGGSLVALSSNILMVNAVCLNTATHFT